MKRYSVLPQRRGGRKHDRQRHCKRLSSLGNEVVRKPINGRSEIRTGKRSAGSRTLLQKDVRSNAPFITHVRSSYRPFAHPRRTFENNHQSVTVKPVISGSSSQRAMPC